MRVPVVRAGARFSFTVAAAAVAASGVWDNLFDEQVLQHLETESEPAVREALNPSKRQTLAHLKPFTLDPNRQYHLNPNCPSPLNIPWL